MGDLLKHTQTQALLEEVRAKLNGATDYRIAKTLQIQTQRVSDYRKGDRQADAYACARFAEVLGRDPLELIAMVETETARTEAARTYWRSFIGGIRRTTIVGGALWLIASFSGGAPTIGAAQAAEASTHNGRFRQRTAQKQSPRLGAFFSCSGSRTVKTILNYRGPDEILRSRTDRPQSLYSCEIPKSNLYGLCFPAWGGDPGEIERSSVLHRGPVRGRCALFRR